MKKLLHYGRDDAIAYGGMKHYVLQNGFTYERYLDNEQVLPL